MWPLEAGHAKASIPNEHLLPPEAEMGTRGLNGRSLQPSQAKEGGGCLSGNICQVVTVFGRDFRP